MHRYLLLAALLVQAVLWLPNLGLLPVWGDEQFTLSTVVQPVDTILEAVRADVHPPFYYLLSHFWLKLPLPSSEIERIRLLSALAGLLATFAVYRCWIQPLKPALRAWFVVIWALSPFLLLYCRMGRSYSLQLLLASLALRYGVDPGNRRSMVQYILWTTLLLYTHYLPGIAVPIGVSVYWLWKRQAFRKLAAVHALILLLYLPWIGALRSAAATAVNSGEYRLTSNEVLEHGVRIAYTFLATTFGETLPPWALLAALLVSPVILWLLWQGVRSRPEWLPALPAAAFVAYAGAAAGVIFALTPARLIFLFPFYVLLLVYGRERAGRLGAIALCAMLVISIAATASYYRKENFLNKGYVLPLDEIAAAANRDLAHRGGLLIVDGSNTQPTPLLANLSPSVRRIASYDRRSLDEVQSGASDRGVRTIWFLRNTHDVTPDRLNEQIESVVLGSFRQTEERSYVAYNAIDRAAMGLLRWSSRPTHVLELLEFERMESK